MSPAQLDILLDDEAKVDDNNAMQKKIEVAREIFNSVGEIPASKDNRLFVPASLNIRETNSNDKEDLGPAKSDLSADYYSSATFLLSNQLQRTLTLNSSKKLT